MGEQGEEALTESSRTEGEWGKAKRESEGAWWVWDDVDERKWETWVFLGLKLKEN